MAQGLAKKVINKQDIYGPNSKEQLLDAPEDANAKTFVAVCVSILPIDELLQLETKHKGNGLIRYN